MFIDTSALIAIMTGEAEQEVFTNAIMESESKYISGLVRLETVMALSRKIKQAPLENLHTLDRLLTALEIECAPLTHEISTLAVEAFAKFGKGQGHPAQLNLSDCMSYAAAKHLRVPLLCKGDDFGRTDVEVVRVKG